MEINKNQPTCTCSFDNLCYLQQILVQCCSFKMTCSDTITISEGRDGKNYTDASLFLGLRSFRFVVFASYNVFDHKQQMSLMFNILDIFIAICCLRCYFQGQPFKGKTSNCNQIRYTFPFIKKTKTLKGSRFQISNYRFVFLSLSNLQKNKYSVINYQYLFCLLNDFMYNNSKKYFLKHGHRKTLTIMARDE